MSRLINVDDIPYAVNVDHPSGEYDFAYRCEIDALPTVDAIPVEWIKKHIESDRQSAEKAKAEKNDKLLHYYRTLEICADCLLFDWEDENGKYEEFRSEEWQD